MIDDDADPVHGAGGDLQHEQHRRLLGEPERGRGGVGQGLIRLRAGRGDPDHLAEPRSRRKDVLLAARGAGDGQERAQPLVPVEQVTDRRQDHPQPGAGAVDDAGEVGRGGPRRVGVDADVHEPLTLRAGERPAPSRVHSRSCPVSKVDCVGYCRTSLRHATLLPWFCTPFRRRFHASSPTVPYRSRTARRWSLTASAR
ncbi:hypothetical protein [Dactylosporangium cerinum]